MRKQPVLTVSMANILHGTRRSPTDINVAKYTANLIKNEERVLTYTVMQTGTSAAANAARS